MLRRRANNATKGEAEGCDKKCECDLRVSRDFNASPIFIVITLISLNDRENIGRYLPFYYRRNFQLIVTFFHNVFSENYSKRKIKKNEHYDFQTFRYIYKICHFLFFLFKFLLLEYFNYTLLSLSIIYFMFYFQNHLQRANPVVASPQRV